MGRAVCTCCDQHCWSTHSKGRRVWAALPAATCYNCVCVFQSFFASFYFLCCTIAPFRVPHVPCPVPRCSSSSHPACSQCHKIFACSATFFFCLLNWSSVSPLSSPWPDPDAILYLPGTSSLVFSFCGTYIARFTLPDWRGHRNYGRRKPTDWAGSQRNYKKVWSRKMYENVYKHGPCCYRPILEINNSIFQLDLITNAIRIECLIPLGIRQHMVEM